MPVHLPTVGEFPQLTKYNANEAEKLRPATPSEPWGLQQTENARKFQSTCQTSEYVPSVSLIQPISNAMLSCIAGAVDTSFAQHNRTNGSTVSLVHGTMVGKQLFSVSIYPGRSITLWDRPSWNELFEFAKANLELLLRPAHALGTWFNDWELVHVVDVVVCVPDRDAALDLGLRFEQVAIYDLDARREIPVPQPCREPAVKLAEVGNE